MGRAALGVGSGIGLILVYDDDDLLPLSALQHLVFCERRAALILIEGQWRDNLYTAEGGALHEKAHRSETENRPGVRIARALPLKSSRLGLAGKADVVEFHQVSSGGVTIAGAEGCWRPYPVEYKRGRRRREASFEVQLCAQALCIEEMLSTRVPAGALYYGKTRRRLEIAFEAGLREQTEHAAARLHAMVQSGRTPLARRTSKCAKCSLEPVCMSAAAARGRLAHYITRIFEDAAEEQG